MSLETRRTTLVERIRNLPLRHRLVIPFFFMALIGTVSLVAIAIISQNDLIQKEEYERLRSHDVAVQHGMEILGKWAVSIASGFARNPEVVQALADRDRLRLISLCYPAYIFMKDRYGISQLNFHTYPPRNFVRLQRLNEFGDSLEYRQTILDAVTQRKETYGLEFGITGYGIRGVVPIFHGDDLIGSVEVGFSSGSIFLLQMEQFIGVEASFLFPDESGSVFRAESSTLPLPFERTEPVYREVFRSGKAQIISRSADGAQYVVLIRSITDYKGERIGLAEFCLDHTRSMGSIKYYRTLMLGLGVIGMIISVAGIFLISSYFTRPIGRMIEFAREIARGGPVRPLEVTPAGELGILADALNEMYASLEESKEKIRDHTENLEEKIRQRTRALLDSEQKYRTLVQNVPLVVYRLLADGRTIFINRAIEELIKIPHEKVLADRHFWKEKVFEEDRPRIWPQMDSCLDEGTRFEAEYRMTGPKGEIIYVLDRALPVFDESGAVETVDGFLVDVTDRYCLQRQIIQTEELRTLTEISARLAHEIRNPLTAAGGFARRILQTLPENDSNRGKIQIIVQEVARLEKILERTLAYLKPFDLLTEKVNLNEVIEKAVQEVEPFVRERNIQLTVALALDLVPIALDRVLLKKAFENLLMALAGVCQAGSCLVVRTQNGENNLNVELTARGVKVSDDDVQHFFYPFTGGQNHTWTFDLPLAKMIVHKHGGLIDLKRKEPGKLQIFISLPQ